MGTNYYARIIPTKQRKDEIKEAIDNDDFSLIRKLVEENYGKLEYSWEDEDLIGGIVHLGKRSAGWKFLWNPNIYIKRNGHFDVEKGMYVQKPDSAIYLYPLTKEGIKSFIDSDNVRIYDEYGRQQDKEKFWDMTINWTTWHGEEAWDADSYEAEHPREGEWYHRNDYTNLLEAEGFKLSKNKADFYSDGLRFATSNDFS